MLKNKSNNSKLICVTGFMGVGKSTFMNFLHNDGFEIFIMDKYIHEIYKKNKIGYDVIKTNFGDEYVNNVEVDRSKLRNLVLNDHSIKEKLDSLMIPIIINKIKELIKRDKTIFVELAIYVFHPNKFKNLFKNIILIRSTRGNINDNFSKFHSVEMFSTKDVENLKNNEKMGIFLPDLIVENNENIENYEIKIKKILDIYKNNK